jgi:murein DD-endopeptidase MepM/ murein hydrolase activator NlpD
MRLRVTSDYGWRTHPRTQKRTFHDGLDLGYRQGSPLVALGSGRVSIARQDDGGAGTWLRVDHGGGWSSTYMHLSSLGVHPGQIVERGQLVGASGGAAGTPGAGNSTGPHLHLELEHNGRSVDPVTQIDWSPITLEFKHPDGVYRPGRPRRASVADWSWSFGFGGRPAIQQAREGLRFSTS